jgi:muconolactone delta-isomerase
MLFLTTSEAVGKYPLPPKEWLELVMKMLETIMDYKQKGKIVVHGAYVGRHAGCIIWDVESHTDLQSLLIQLPLWPLMEWEIIPLLSTADTFESVKQALKAL